MSGISTHVLDTGIGKPASGVRAELEYRSTLQENWSLAGEGRTDQNGRIPQLLEDGKAFAPGFYRLTFFTAEYLEGRECFYPAISVFFQVRDASVHYHIPLLLSPYGYTTYRGS